MDRSSRLAPVLTWMVLAGCGEGLLGGPVGDAAGGARDDAAPVVGVDVDPSDAQDAGSEPDAGAEQDAGSEQDADPVIDAGTELDAGPITPPDSGPSDTGIPPEQEPPGLVGITEAHNRARATVGVGPLVWDPALAQVAQAWADTCTDQEAPAGLLDHNAGRSSSYPGYVGENIYAASGQATPAGAVNAWVSESQYYDYATNSCAAGRICGHYTQVVWAASLRLGCGLSNCPSLRYSSTIVCDYSPGGNTGGRPY